jgi:hypothetical protein
VTQTLVESILGNDHAMLVKDFANTLSPDAVAQGLILVMVHYECLPQVQAYRTYHVFSSIADAFSIWQREKAVTSERGRR